jgi:hypothetical protein
MKHLLKFYAILLLGTLFTSCSTARLTSSWTNETYTAQKYNKVLVFAIASQTSNRAAVEGAMTNELKKKGINAISSLSVFPNSQNAISGQQILIPKEELAQKLKDKNIDGLLVLSLLDRKEEQVYVEGHTTTQSSTSPQAVTVQPGYNYNNGYNYHNNGYNDRYDPYSNDYYVYYETVQTTVTEPGYYENQTTLYLESNFYRVSDASLAWSAQSEVVNPSDVSSSARDWAVQLTKAMIKYQIILP